MYKILFTIVIGAALIINANAGAYANGPYPSSSVTAAQIAAAGGITNGQGVASFGNVSAINYVNTLGGLTSFAASGANGFTGFQSDSAETVENISLIIADVQAGSISNGIATFRKGVSSTNFIGNGAGLTNLTLPSSALTNNDSRRWTNLNTTTPQITFGTATNGIGSYGGSDITGFSGGVAMFGATNGGFWGTNNTLLGKTVSTGNYSNLANINVVSNLMIGAANIGTVSGNSAVLNPASTFFNGNTRCTIGQSAVFAIQTTSDSLGSGSTVFLRNAGEPSGNWAELDNNSTYSGLTNAAVLKSLAVSNLLAVGIVTISPHVPNAVTVGASPFNYTNNTGINIECYFSGGTAYSVSKDGVAVFGSLAGDGYFALQPTNTCTITYTIAPTFYTNAW